LVGRVHFLDAQGGADRFRDGQRMNKSGKFRKDIDRGRRIEEVWPLHPTFEWVSACERAVELRKQLAGLHRRCPQKPLVVRLPSVFVS
jgi:hypothetical protein